MLHLSTMSSAPLIISGLHNLAMHCKVVPNCDMPKIGSKYASTQLKKWKWHSLKRVHPTMQWKCTFLESSFLQRFQKLYYFCGGRGKTET